MKITVYSSPGCLACEEVKDILDANNLSYESFVVATPEQPSEGDITHEEFHNQHSFVWMMPYITADDNVKIAGLPTFKKWMEHLGY